ncbi:unnamed protein product [Prunus armeniaca]
MDNPEVQRLHTFYVFLDLEPEDFKKLLCFLYLYGWLILSAFPQKTTLLYVPRKVDYRGRKNKSGPRSRSRPLETALHQLVSPFGKTDTASVLLEAIGYIRFLQGQIEVINMASSAAAIPPQEKYDVFLSFRGEDTRYTFTSHLYAALCSKKIKTYIDDILERGEQIAPALFEAIETSKLSVIIFSKNYASSTWCLDELVHIPRCKARGDSLFYQFFTASTHHMFKISREVMHMHFLNLKHVSTFKDSTEGVMKVWKWRDALKAAANMAGFDNSNKRGTEANFIENIVEDFFTILNCKSSSDLKGLVGIEWRIEQIEGLLCINSPDVFTVGIWGMGGIGKTTLADAVYHRLSSKFEASCFLANVRVESEKHGLKHLRNVLREILNETDLREVFRMVVDYAGGMPLALKILGSIFLHCDNNEDWKDEWNKLKKFPNQDIENMLRLIKF